MDVGLVLCLIAAGADELPVIKDSEAIHYVGKSVEVRGFVVSVTTSPLGTAFINFGREYPNQTFAGFIAAGSKMATEQLIAMLQGKIVDITGTIELYEGKPEIKVLSMNRIKGVDSHPVRLFDLRGKARKPGDNLAVHSNQAYHNRSKPLSFIVER